MITHNIDVAESASSARRARASARGAQAGPVVRVASAARVGWVALSVVRVAPDDTSAMAAAHTADAVEVTSARLCCCCSPVRAR